jgi:hypothetical protein
MNVEDTAVLIAVRKKLIESETRLYEANQILTYIFDKSTTEHKSMSSGSSGGFPATGDPVTGLFAGQLSYPKEEEDEVEEEAECLD